MPFASSKPCAKCRRALAEPGSPYCKAHSNHSQKQHDKRRGSSAVRGYDHKWRKASKAFKARNPLCAICYKKGILSPVDGRKGVVDHSVHIK